MHRKTLFPILLAATLPVAAQSGPRPAPARAPKPADAIVVPAGTRVLLKLRSAINTKSAKPGDGVYLSSTFPVVVGNRVVIPAGVYVQGVVDRVVHPGRFRGRAELNMHFTSIIFPNGSVVDVPGVVNSLPGAQNQAVKDHEGTIEEQGGGKKAHNAAEAAKVAVPTGATVGAIGGLNAGHPLAGGLEGAAAGLAVAGVVALFTRKADINISAGTQVEMVLQRPLWLKPANLSPTGGPGALTPAPNQSSNVLTTPTLRRHLFCPAGSLGCS